MSPACCATSAADRAGWLEGVHSSTLHVPVVANTSQATQKEKADLTRHVIFKVTLVEILGTRAMVRCATPSSRKRWVVCYGTRQQRPDLHVVPTMTPTPSEPPHGAVHSTAPDAGASCFLHGKLTCYFQVKQKPDCSRSTHRSPVKMVRRSQDSN